MRRYGEAFKADVRRMSPPQRQSMARIAEELGIHAVTLYNWRNTWRPRLWNEDPLYEVLFRTVKQRPDYATQPFFSHEDKVHVRGDFYNHCHHHRVGRRK